MKVNGLALVLACLMIGCVQFPIPGPMAGFDRTANDDDVYYAFSGADLYLLVVTDGTINELGCTQSIGYGSTWACEIEPLRKGDSRIPVRASHGSVRIGERKFKLREGRAFTVTTGGETTEIRQVAKDQSMVRLMLDHDPRLKIASFTLARSQ